MIVQYKISYVELGKDNRWRADNGFDIVKSIRRHGYGDAGFGLLITLSVTMEQYTFIKLQRNIII